MSSPSGTRPSRGLLLTTEQEDLRDSVRRFVADRSPMTAVRAVVAAGSGFDRGLWQAMSRGLGFAGLRVPARYGGSGASWTDVSVVLSELGRGLVPSPLLSALLSAEVLLRLDDEDARRELLPGVASGDRIAALAVSEETAGEAGWFPAEPATRATSTDARTARITGRKTTVIDARHADLLLVQARAEDGNALYVVDGDAGGLQRTALTTLDLTRSVATVDLVDVPARRLAGDADGVLDQVTAVANLALASEQCGAMAACLDMTTQYAAQRYAFGRPIGSFQAVKHRLAEMLLAWELAYSALRDATRCADEEPDLTPQAAAIARVLVSPAYFRAAADTVQLHGGIGYTWDHDAHLYYRNATSQKNLLGRPQHHLDLLAVLHSGAAVMNPTRQEHA